MIDFARLMNSYGRCVCTALVLLSSSPAGAESVRRASAPAAHALKADDFLFPKALAGLPRNGRIDYKAPGAGFSVSYGKHGTTWADIFVYDRQLDLTSGPPLSLARKELESALDEVHAAMRLGPYQSVVIQGQSVSGLFAGAHLRITAAGKERDSFVFVTVHKGRFVKIRLTSSAGANARRTAETFLAEYERALNRR